MTKELLSVQFTLKYFLVAAGTQDLGYEGLNGRWAGSICRLYIQIFRSLFVVDKMKIERFKRELFSLDYFYSSFTLLTEFKLYTKCITLNNSLFRTLSLTIIVCHLTIQQ